MYAWVLKQKDEYIGYEEDCLFLTERILSATHYHTSQSAEEQLKEIQEEYPELADTKMVKIEIRELP